MYRLIDTRKMKCNETEAEHDSKPGRQRSSPCLITSLITTNNLGRWSPMESGNFFLHIIISLSSFLLSSQEKHHTFHHFLKLPVVCPVWSALPAWLFAFASQNTCVYYDFFFGSLPCLPSDRFFSSRFTLTAKWY